MTRVVMLTFFVVVGLVVGCNSNGSKSAAAAPTSPGVLDVSPTVAPIPAEQPVAAQPVADVQPIAYAPEAAAMPAKKTYTIKKGDTLFSIAKASYGSGRDWQKIASANPGIEPSKLKVGQQIVIP